MVSPAFLQLVPASLLLFIATTPFYVKAREIPWPFGSLRSSSRDRSLFRRDDSPGVNAEAHMLVGVRKMSDDQGEMFFPEYWSFGASNDHDTQLNLGKRKATLRSLGRFDERNDSNDWANTSIPQPFQAPFALHTDLESESRPLGGSLLKSPRAIFPLDKRDFQCPGNTIVCTLINRPNSCCPTGTTCNIVTDTGYGDVGCCGQGQTCSGQVANCPTGDTACSESSTSGSTGGGCCISGYTCNGAGCKSLHS